MLTDDTMDAVAPPREAVTWYARIGFPAVVILLSTLPFITALSAGFTNWDDPNNILENMGFRGFTREHLDWMWSTVHLGVYEPLGWMLKAAIYAVAGLNPQAFHAVSIVLHAANAWLVYAIGVRLLRRAMPLKSLQQTRIGAAVAALLFSMHPLRSEVVVWASGQPYLLSSFFALLAAWMYVAINDGLATTRERRMVGIMLVTLAYAAGTLSKTAALPLPMVLLVLDVYPLGRVGRSQPLRNLLMLTLEKSGMLLVAVAVAVKAQSISTISNIDPSLFSMFDRLQLAGYSVYFCISKTIWPAGLSPFYPLPFPYQGLPKAFTVCAVIAAGASVAALLLYRRKPALTAAWIAFLLWLAPASGFVRHGDQYGADRYTYLSCISFALVMGSCAAAVLFAGRRWVKRVTAIGLASLITVMGWLTSRQSWNWCESGRLWEHAMAVDPENWVGLNNLANYYLESGNLPRALELADAGLKRWPTYHDIIMTKGLVLEQQEQYRESVALFRRALELKPKSDVVSNLAADLRKLGRVDEGIELMRERLKQSPNDLRCLGNLGTILIEEGRGAEAVPYLEKAVSLQPRSSELHYKLARACIGGKSFEKAERALARLAELKPDYPKLNYYRGVVFNALGRVSEAMKEFAAAVEADPSHVEARLDFAAMLAGAKREREAVAQWNAVLKLSPGHVTALINLAWISATSEEDGLRDGAEARRYAEQSVRITRRRNAKALMALAAALAEMGMITEAMDQAEQAKAQAGGDAELQSQIDDVRSALANGKPIRGVRINMWAQ